MYKSQIFILIFLLFICGGIYAQSWVTEGSAGFSAGPAYNTCLAISKSGTPYVAYMDSINDYKATVMKCNGINWVAVGSPAFSAGGVFFTSIAIDTSGTPYVVFDDSANGEKATVMKFNGSSWVTVGSPGFTDSMVTFPTIAIDRSGTPYVVFIAGNPTLPCSATVMKFNGSSWVTVGSPGFTNPGTEFTSIAIDEGGTPYVAYQDNEAKATVMKYNGSSWGYAGIAGFSAGSALNTSIAIDGSGTPYVAYCDGSFFTNNATVMKYNGSSWVTVGSAGFSASEATYTSIAIDVNDTPYVAYSDWENGQKATVMKYNGSSWVTVGSVGFSAATAYNTSIAIDGNGTPYVGYMDLADSGKATVMKFGTFTSVKEISNPAVTFSIFPNPNEGSFIINLSSSTNEEAQIILTNMAGEKVKEFRAATNTDTEIRVDVPTGMYFMTAVTDDGNSETQKLTVR